MKWALILGATGAIGQQIVQDLAKDGWSLYLQGFRQQKLLGEQVKTLTEKYPEQDFIAITADLTQLANQEQIVNNIFSLDALVAAQGVTDYDLFADVSSSKMAEILTVNLTFPLQLIQKLQDKLAQSGHGRIVLLGSVYGSQGSAMEVMYSTTKGALSSFAKAYAKEVASLGITVNVLAPGAVDTTMNKMLDLTAKSELEAEIPVGFMAKAQDVSYWITAILAERAQYLTGQTIYVTGGWLE